MLRIALNGFGRMGRLALRAGWGRPNLSFVAINDPGQDPATAAHLLEFDSVHGRWSPDSSPDSSIMDTSQTALTIGGRSLAYSMASTPADCPWSGETVDVVFECSGKFRSPQSLQPFFDRGIKKVIVAAPVKDPRALNIVMGVNDHLYDPAQHHLLTAASCTTNCLAPVVKVIHEALGIKHGSMTTIHDVTNTQTIVDGPHKDLRRARSCLNSLIPTSTGSATAIGLIYPELQGKLNGHAVRVPLLNASLTDCVFEVKSPTAAETVNALFQQAACGSLAGILGYEARPLVSSDFTNDPRSTIIDGPSTMVINQTQVKIYAWYDNEWGYVNRMVELAQKVGALR